MPGRVINPLCENLDLLPVGYGIDLVNWHQGSEAFRELAGPQRVGLSGQGDAEQIKCRKLGRL